MVENDKSSEPDFVFLVPQPVVEVPGTLGDDDELERQAKIPERLAAAFGARKVTVNAEEVRDFWSGRVVPLARTMSEQAADTLGGYRVDEISFTIGVGVEGGLFFVGKATAEASIEVTLKREDPGAGVK